MVKYLDPNNTLSTVLKAWTKSTATTNEARMTELKEKMAQAVSALKTYLSTQNTWFELKGTDWCVSLKLNIQEQPTWDFELFTTKPSLIKTRTTDV